MLEKCFASGFVLRTLAIKPEPVIPASLIGQGILVFVAPVARRCNIGTSEKDIIPFCAGTLVLAAILLGILLLTAPGVKLTVPL